MRALLASALLTRLEQICDVEGDTHLGTAEKYAILSSAVAGTWDHIVSAGLGGEYVKNVSFTTTAGTAEYPVATAIVAGDFYKVSEMYVDEGSGQYRPIQRVPPGERQAWRAPTGAVTIKLYYLPCAPVWTLGTESFDGINGWEEHTLATAAITIKNKKHDDAAPFKAIKRDLEERIHTMGNRNQAEAPRIVRRARNNRWNAFLPYRSNVSGWDLRGDNFEFLYHYGMSPYGV